MPYTNFVGQFCSQFRPNVSSMSEVKVYSRSDVSTWLQKIVLEQPAILLDNQAAVFSALYTQEQHEGSEHPHEPTPSKKPGETTATSQTAQPSQDVAPIQIPQRLAIDNPKHTMLFMPSRAVGTTAAKIVAVPKPNKGPAGIPGVTLLFDDDSGRMKALVDASVLTPARTAAGSVLATILAMPPQGLGSALPWQKGLARAAQLLPGHSDNDQDGSQVRTIALFGGGQQSFWHALLLASVYRSTLRTILFFPATGRSASSRTLLESVQALCAAVAGLSRGVEDAGAGMDVRIETDLDTLVQADIIVTATPASEPLFPPEKARKGVHLVLVGSCTYLLAAAVWRGGCGNSLCSASGKVDVLTAGRGVQTNHTCKKCTLRSCVRRPRREQ